ncbi:MAG: glycosyltransferase family 9 protein [bacterium]
MEKFIVICMQGIGNTVLFLPALHTLKERYPQSRVDCLVRLEGSRQILEADPSVGEIFLLNERTPGKLGRILELRGRRYDCSITAFPGNRLEFNALAFAIGARIRIAHRYKLYRIRSANFLQNRTVDVSPTLRDIEQNLRLLEPLGIDSGATGWDMKLFLTEDDESYAEEFWERNRLKGDFVVGFHPGGSKERGMIHKRWAKERFIALGNELARKYGARVLTFGGPDESGLKEEISRGIPKSIVVEAGIRQVAAAIGRCGLFISNDSGLMNIAMAVGVPTVGILGGPTDPVRVRPYRDNCVIVKSDIHCYPCRGIETLGRRFACIYDEIECLKRITVEQVLTAVDSLMKSGKAIRRMENDFG